MKKISIKTVDGNRYDYLNGTVKTWETPDGWLCVKEKDSNTIKQFYIQNIVCITEKEIDDG